MLIQNAKIYVYSDNDWSEVTHITACDISFAVGPSRPRQDQEGFYTKKMIDEFEIQFERGYNPILDASKLNDLIKIKFDDGAVEYVVTTIVSTKETIPNQPTYIVLSPLMDEPIQYIPKSGEEGPKEYLKTIEKDTTEGRIYIKDQDDHVTDFPYGGGSGGSVDFEDIIGNPRDNDNLNVQFTHYDEKIATLDAEADALEMEIDVLDEELKTKANISDVNDLTERVSESEEDISNLVVEVNEHASEITQLGENKQNKLTAGTNITIVNDVISATSVTPTDVYWSTLPYSSSDDTLITQYLSNNYYDKKLTDANFVNTTTDQTIGGYKTFVNKDGIKVSEADGLNYVRYGSGTIHYKRLDVDDEFDYLLPAKSGTFALHDDIINVQANPTSEATATLNKLKVGDTTYNISGGGGDATVYLVDAELNYQTGEIIWHSESISEDVLAYFDEHEYFPTIKLHLVVKYQGQVVQETNCDSKDNMKVESEDGDYLMSRFIIDGIKESSSEGDKLEIQQFIYEDYGAEGKVGEVVEFSTESFQASKYHDKKQVEVLLEQKQDTLTPGDNITIVDNVISAQIGERAPTFIITAEYNEETEEWVITSDNYYSQIITFYNTNNYYPSIFLRIGQNDYALKDITKNEDESLRLATDSSDSNDLYFSSNKYVITLANSVQRLEHWSKLISDYAIRAQFTDNDEVSVTQINNGVQEVVKTPRLQKKLTAGDNITIIEDVISATNQLKNMYIHYVYLEEVTEDLINNSSPELFIITDDPTPYTTMYRFFEDISASNKISYRGPLHLKFINQYGDLELGFAHVLFTNLEELEPGKGELVFDYQVGATPDDGIIKTTRRIGFNEDNARIIDTVVPLFPNIFYCDYQFEHCTTQQSKWYIPGQQKFIQVTAEPGYKLPANITHSENLTTVWWTQSTGYLIFNGPSENSWVKITAEPI